MRDFSVLANNGVLREAAVISVPSLPTWALTAQY